jgi:hypothetical protein
LLFKYFFSVGYGGHIIFQIMNIVQRGVHLSFHHGCTVVPEKVFRTIECS